MLNQSLSTQYLLEKENFIYEFEKAVSIANSGRKGPVWIDIPLEFQWSDIPYKESKQKIKKQHDLNSKVLTI